jgi:hypothetical protein
MIPESPFPCRCWLLQTCVLTSHMRHYFLVFVTLRGTILSADMELTMLSMSTLTGITGAPYGRLRVDPDLFLPFHSGETTASC